MTAARPPRTKTQRLGRARSLEVRRFLADDLRKLREDCGLSQSRLAAAAGISQSVVSNLEAANADPGTEVVARLAAALGGRLSLRIDPGTGPLVRDHIQAAMLDALLKVAHTRWRRLLEVAIYRPVSGVIDAVLYDRSEAVIVATEFQSELRRIEQQLRWAGAKADALASGGCSHRVRRALAIGQSPDDPPANVAQLLVLRSSTANHRVVATYPEVFAAAYPAPHAALRDALLGQGAWPGNGLLWMTVQKGKAEIREDVPRGIALGRG